MVYGLSSHVAHVVLFLFFFFLSLFVFPVCVFPSTKQYGARAQQALSCDSEQILSLFPSPLTFNKLKQNSSVKRATINYVGANPLIHFFPTVSHNIPDWDIMHDSDDLVTEEKFLSPLVLRQNMTSIIA